jgi:type II secretory pathway pseudopilin PulG
MRRTGFTLVELLVAAALILFMMMILTQAFATATQTFRELKAAGDMAERLRALTTQLRYDLACDHFEGKRRLSDPSFWGTGPPAQGFFRVEQGSRPVASGGPCILEGMDTEGLTSYRTADHRLHFTVKMRGNHEGRYFAAKVPSDSPLLQAIFGPPEARFQTTGDYRYQWAEVAYFLRPALNDQGIPDTANGTPLYSLYRRQRLAVLDNTLVVPTQPATRSAEYLEVSCEVDKDDPQRLYFNNAIDLTIPSRRFGTRADGIANYPTLAEQTTDADLRGADVALTDVVSFDVRLLFATHPAYPGPSDARNPFLDLYDVSLDRYNHGNAQLFAANGPRVFDTWSSAAATVPDLNYAQWNLRGTTKSIPMWNEAAPEEAWKGPIVKAIQVTIRVWDVRTAKTRQVTIVQGM